MSLPLTRRIARAALLVAAGAAPVVGAAGSASALDHSLAPTDALSGLSVLDAANAGSAVDTAGQAGETLGQTAGAATESAQAPAAGALGDAVPNTGALPGAGLIGGLPIGG
ncbi:ATP-binding protein [Streptomyces sp. NPDC012637]|uniref:ATP-binding protein n=1 Tax=Streptomyces sp. NPDC012637 TaxID=3364842 RepID=UPI0036E21AD3